MKRLAYLLLCFFTFISANAQILDPVKWTSKIEKKSDTEYVLIFDAVIEDDWHVYSQHTPEGGVLPLEVLFNNDKGNFEALGKAEESKTRTAFNDIFGVDEIFFEKSGQLRQIIKITNPKNTVIQAELSYQVCK
ncbi:MAG: thiol:disulfide interchange protein, partial [Flavobacterium sp.]